MSSMTDMPAGVEILPEGFKFQFDSKGCTATMRFYFPNSALDDFRKVIGGLPETITYSGGTTVTRYIPLKLEAPYAPVPAGILCLADDCEIYPANMRATPLDPDEVPADLAPPSIVLEDWFAEVHFSTVSWTLDGDFPLVTKTMSTSLEHINRPGSAFHFPSDGMRLDAPVGVPVSNISFTWVMHKMPTFNETLLKALTGKVNSLTFAGDPPGTVLFLGADTDGQRSLQGQTYFEVAYKFQYRELPHNWQMRPTGSGGPGSDGFEAPVDAEGNEKNKSLDLNLLFY